MAFCAQVCVRCWLVRNRRFRGGPYVLASLAHMADGCGRREFQFFLIWSSVRLGQVIRCPSLTVCNIADLVGLNRAL
jgi:hypothetical protein